MKIFPGLLLTSLCCATLCVQAFADVFTKDNNSTALNLAGSWVGNTTVPTASDDILFDSTLNLTTSTANATTSMTADLSVLGIQIGGATGPTLGQANGKNGIEVTNASSANTLTVGTDGITIDPTNGVPMLLQSRVALSDNQTWSIGDASARITTPAATTLGATQPTGSRYTAFGGAQDEDLDFYAQAAATPFNLGGYTLDKTGNGTVMITAGYTVTNGTINVDNGVFVIQGGASRVTTVDNTVGINVSPGATLRYQATSGALTSNASINLFDGSVLNLTCAGAAGNSTVGGSIAIAGNATLSFTNNPISGAANVINYNISAPLSGGPDDVINLQFTQTGATSTMILTGDNSGFTGTININGASGDRAVRLSSATAGSPDATWTVSSGNALQVAGFSVQLGTLNGAGNVTATATGSVINVGAGTFSGSITGNTATFMSLNKITSGTLTLSGNSTYTGATTVNAGTLQVNGLVPAAGSVAVNSTGTLAGNGTVGTITLNSGGAVVPGTNGTVGTLHGTALTWNGGGQALFDLGTSSDQLVLTGALTKGTAGTYGFVFTGGTSLANGTTITLATFGSTSFTAQDLSSTGGPAGSFAVNPTNLRFVVSAIGNIAGTVTNSASAAIQGASVSVVVSGTTYSTTSAANGTYTITSVPAGTGYTVTASATGYLNGTASSIAVTTGGTTSGVNFALNAAPGAITGTVTNSASAAISGASVSVVISGTTYSTTSAANGTYTIGSLPAGTGYTVTASATGYFNGTATNVTVTAGDTTSGVNFALNAIPGTITGTVTDNASVAISGASVSVVVSGMTYSATSGSDGIYSIGSVPAGTGYTVTASATGYLNGTATNVTVTSGGTTSGINFTLSPAITTGTITGTVTNSASAAISGASVSVVAGGTTYSATSGSDGTYSIGSVPAGSGYTVTAGKSGYANGTAAGVAVTAGQTTANVNITLTISFASWQALNFTPDELADPSISGPAADPDHDGIPNLLEYAFNLNPKVADRSGLPVLGTMTVSGSQYLTVSYTQQTLSGDLTYTIQSSPDMATWSAITPVPVSTVDNGNGTQTVVVRDPVALDASTRRFLRVQANTP